MHVNEDAAEDVLAPAVSAVTGATVAAELSATRMVNNDEPARMPPTGRAPSRAKDSGDMPAQHLEGNARESGEDIEHHAFAEDVTTKKCRRAQSETHSCASSPATS